VHGTGHNASPGPSARVGGIVARGPSAAVTSPPASGSGGSPGYDQGAADALAAQPMLSVDPSAALPSTLSPHDPGALQIPKATATGAADVATGFPQTPAGALGQLAAIDQAAFEGGALDSARQVIAAWALPGGPTTASWTGVKAMAQMLSAAGLSGGGSQKLALVVTPLMGQIKGTLGPGFVVPCLDYEFDATLNRTARAAVADCQRMVWDGAEWKIGPGAEPGDSPSIWPDTDLAIAAGYKDLRYV
jgi:hypothetical protein